MTNGFNFGSKGFAKREAGDFNASMMTFCNFEQNNKLFTLYISGIEKRFIFHFESF